MVVYELHAEHRQHDKVLAAFPIIEQGTVVSKRGIVRQGGAQEHAQRCSAVTVHRAEAAHLFQLDGAPISKMLSA